MGNYLTEGKYGPKEVYLSITFNDLRKSHGLKMLGYCVLPVNFVPFFKMTNSKCSLFLLYKASILLSP